MSKWITFEEFKDAKGWGRYSIGDGGPSIMAYSEQKKNGGVVAFVPSNEVPYFIVEKRKDGVALFVLGQKWMKSNEDPPILHGLKLELFQKNMRAFRREAILDKHYDLLKEISKGLEWALALGAVTYAEETEQVPVLANCKGAERDIVDYYGRYSDKPVRCRVCDDRVIFFWKVPF